METPMYRETRVVKLRKSGLKAVIAVLSKNDATYFTSYIYTTNEHSFKLQVIFAFCENYLTDIIPVISGMTVPERKIVFDELYESIVEHNPTVTKVRPPTKMTEDEVTELESLLQKDVKTSLQLKSVKKAKKLSITKEKVRSIAPAIKKKIYGQDAVIDRIAEMFMCATAGVSGDVRPRGSFVFIGDTGTGKTQTVRELAKHFFGDDWRQGLYVINGSEFMAEHEVSKLLGAPHGYVGFEEGSPLMKHMQANPESIILVDEFEKAHNRLQDVFLQILDDGACYDNSGNRIEFNKSFIVFTSNIGTREIFHETKLGFVKQSTDKSDVDKSVLSALARSCRVEFIKRFDGIVVFNQLQNDSMVRIAAKELEELGERLSEKKIRFIIGKGVSEHITTLMEEHDTSRDVQHLVRAHVTIPIAKLLSGEEDYNSIKVSVVNGEIKVVGRVVGQ